MSLPWDVTLALAADSLEDSLRRVERRADTDSIFENNNVFRYIEQHLVKGRYLIDLAEESNKNPQAVALNAEHSKRSLGHPDSRDRKRPKAGPSIPTEVATPRLYLTVRGRAVDAIDYLQSKEFMDHLNAITDPETDVSPVNGLETFPKDWQLVGQEKLFRMAAGPFSGGFICDPVGMGKSLTALMAAIRIRRTQPGAGPILITTKKSCILQWYDEVRRHFAKDCRPTVIILDLAQYPLESLMEYDIVICSHQFVSSRYTDKQIHHDYHEWLHGGNIREAKELFGDQPQRIYQPLHSQLYRLFKKIFPVLILDEAHECRNPNSELHKAVLSLDYQCIFLLTGTPIHNVFEDLYGQMALLPGCPFENVQHFREFGGATEESRTRLGHPRKPHGWLFKRLVPSMILARPKRILALPPKHEHVIEVELKDPWLVGRITDHVNKGQWQLSRSHNQGLPPKKRESAAKKAFAAFSAAASLAASRILWDKAMEGKAQRQTIIAQIRAEGREAKPKEQGELGHPRGGQHQSASNKEKSEKELVKPEPGSRRQRSPPAVYSVRDFRAAERYVGGYREDFFYKDDANDKSCDPGRGGEGNNLDLDVESDYDGASSDDVDDAADTKGINLGDPRLRFPGRSDDKYTSQWLKELKSLADDDIFSPRVTAIVDTVRDIRENYPGEKIIVVADKIMVLDIVNEAVRRRGLRDALLNVETAEYNGTIKSAEARAEILRQFNLATRGAEILFLSAAAGGTGLNITGASHIIKCQPFWTPGLSDQITGRVYRLPQAREVHIYEVFSADSAIDKMLRDAVQEKQEAREDISWSFTRLDGAPFILPRIPTMEELAEAGHSDDDEMGDPEDEEFGGGT